MRFAQLPLWLLLAVALMCLPALADPPASEFDGQWGELSAVLPLEFELNGPLIGGDTQSVKPDSKAHRDLDVGGNKVKFGTVDGAPGARVTRQSSKVSVGLGLAPAISDDQDSPSEGFAALEDGFSGAFELKLRDGPLTPSMTMTGPLAEGTGGETDRGGEFRTMFGLGYTF